jgi:16S rRNA (uracil1498-N3)-methyltransferase
MEYFYTTPEHIADGSLSIEGEEFAHLTHVMRKKVGDVIGVVDGMGNLYEAEITDIRRRTASCAIRSHLVRPGEPRVRLHLGVGILKNSARFDYLVEKSTELGVATVTPLLTSRTIPRHAKSDRWQKLALAAMKQSGRSVLPRVAQLTALTDFLASPSAGAMKLIPHTEGDRSSLQKGAGASEVIACIGPEGGFTDAEISLATSAGFRMVSLGPLRLRTETAAVVATVRILAGDD